MNIYLSTVYFIYTTKKLQSASYCDSILYRKHEMKFIDNSRQKIRFPVFIIHLFAKYKTLGGKYE